MSVLKALTSALDRLISGLNARRRLQQGSTEIGWRYRRAGAARRLWRHAVYPTGPVPNDRFTTVGRQQTRRKEFSQVLEQVNTEFFSRERNRHGQAIEGFSIPRAARRRIARNRLKRERAEAKKGGAQ